MLINLFLENEFMSQALMVGFFISLGLPVLGFFLSLKKMSLAGDALSHSLLPGIVIAFAIYGFSFKALFFGGVASSVLAVLVLLILKKIYKFTDETSLSVVFILFLSIGVALSAQLNSSKDFLHILFGNILAVSSDTVDFLPFFSVLTLFLVFIFRRALFLSIVDPGFFQQLSKRQGTLNGMFLLLLVLNLVLALDATGSLMSLGLALLPSLIARQWTSKIDLILFVSVVCSFFSIAIGLILSFYVGLAVGAAVIIILFSMLLLSALKKLFI